MARVLFSVAMFSLALALSLALTSGPAPSARVLPFVEDDYPRALAEAKARQLPLFIEAWAPW